MTITNEQPLVAVPYLSDEDADGVDVTQARVVRSEFLKLRTLRSTFFTLGISIVAMAGIGIIICWSTANDWSHERLRRQLRFNPLEDSLAGFNLAQLAIGVFGVLIIAGEYSTGMIRSSLAAVPKRLPMLWAKVGVGAVITFLVMLPSSLIAFFVSQHIIAYRGIQTTWSAPNVPRTVIGVALYLTVVVVIGIGLGALLRNVAGAIATLVGILLVLPVIASALPQTWADRINKYLPSNAGQALLGLNSDSAQLAPWTGFALFCGYAVLSIAAAAWLLRRRDA
jgi:ABC-type transport system involved in multi-copper enzyme maturation permease subunit